MPDLDQLLADAARDDGPVSLPALDTALDTAQASTRRRHALFGCTAVAAIALCGGLIYAGTATTTTPQPHGTQLAAYDHVVGRDTTHPGRILVVGPADKYTADCTKDPDSPVTVSRDGHLVWLGTGMLSPGEKIDFRLGGKHSRVQPGPYYLFSCPKS